MSRLTKPRLPGVRGSCLVIAALSLMMPAMAFAAEAPGWMKPLVLDKEARDSEHLQTAPVMIGTLHDTVSAMARVTADLSRTVLIRPAGEGKVTAVLVTPGQTVQSGQGLVDYTDHALHVLHLQLEQDRAALTSAKATLSEAEQALSRGKALTGSTVSMGEVRRRAAAVQQARSAVVARQADIGMLEHRLTEEFTSVTERIVEDEASTLISPVRGVVQSVQTAVASDLKPGEAVVTVVDLSSVWIVAQLRPDEVSRIGVGGSVIVRPAGKPSGPSFLTHVTTLDAIADPLTGLVRAVCVVDRPAAFVRPGVMLDATLDTNEAVSGMIVPAQALQRIEGHDLVYVREQDGTYAPREVRVKLETPDAVVLEGNLRRGEDVVTEGSFALKTMSLVSGLDTD